MSADSADSCKAPAGNYGSFRLVELGICDINGNPVSENPVSEELSVIERFTAIEDNYKVSSKLAPNLSICEKGFFEDCYHIDQPEPRSDNFGLVMELNHLLSSETTSKNRIHLYV